MTIKKIITTMVTLNCFISILGAMDIGTVVDGDGHLQTVPNPAVATFNTTPAQIDAAVLGAFPLAKQFVTSINNIPAADRTFANTIMQRDRVNYFIGLFQNQLEVLALLGFNQNVAERATTGAAMFDYIRGDQGAYKALKEYEKNGMKNETLSAEQRYWIKTLKQTYKREGLHLNPLKQRMIRIWQAQLDNIGLTFQENTQPANDVSIKVTLDGLAGLDNSVIASLARDGDLYILPFAGSVLVQSTVEATRRALYEAFYNVGHPANAALLTKAARLRQKIAQLTGFEDYASLELSTLMAKSPEAAEQFLDDIIAKVKPLDDAFFAALSTHLPPDVTLDENGNIKPWDLARISFLYEQQNFVDEGVVSEYLTIDGVIIKMLVFFETFFGVKIYLVTPPPGWIRVITLFEVFRASDGQFLGNIYLDPHQREGKSQQPQTIPVFWSITNQNGSIFQPGFAAVTSNLPSSTPTKEALLSPTQARIIFHELGHAMHLLVGSTQISGQSGFQTKTDFIEMPSLVLEQIFLTPEFLKYISGHYQTHNPLPDEFINGYLKWWQFQLGNFIMYQANLAKLSLNFYRNGSTTDANALLNSIFQTYMSRYGIDPNAHIIEQLPHLVSRYFAAYYGYLWSMVMARDVFEAINEAGIFNPTIAKKYVADIVSKGGSAEPATLVKNFLGRPFNNEAFLAYLQGNVPG